MATALERITALPGVHGVFAVDGRTVLLRFLPAYLTTESLAMTGPALERTWHRVVELGVQVARMVLRFEESILLVVRLETPCFLVTWCRAGVDLDGLSVLLDDLRPELQALVRRPEGGAGGGAKQASEGREHERERSGSSGGSPAVTLTAEEKFFLREELARHVGPVASLLLGSAMKVAANREDLVRLLAREIEAPLDRGNFLQAVWAQGLCSGPGEEEGGES